MNSKTTLLLVLALLLAVVGIWWLRPDAADSSDNDRQTSKKLLGLDADEITAFEIKSGHETACSFVRADSQWRMTSPIDGPAQDRTVSDDVSLIAGLEFEKAYGKQDDPPGNDLTSLEKPQGVVKLTDKGGKAHVVRIGKQQPFSTRTYVSKEGDDNVYLVDADLSRALKRKLEDYRGKRVTEIQSADVVRVQVTGAESFTAAKQDTGWAIEAPQKARADLTALNKVISAIANLNVTRFVDDAPESLRIYGLEPPRVSVTITTKPKSATPSDASADADEPVETTVAFGSVIEENVFARIVDDQSPSVFQVPKSVLESVSPELSAVRDKRIVELVPVRAETIVLTTQEGESLSMSRDGVNWKIMSGDPTDATELAERVAVNDLLNTLRDVKAVGFENGARPEFGLDNPNIRLRIDVQGKTEPIELAVGAMTPSQTGTYLKNVAEDFVAVIPADDAKKLLIKPVAFRSRDILNFNPDHVGNFSLRRLSKSMTLEQVDGAWRMTSPIDTAAEGANVRTLLTGLSSLKGRAVVGTAAQRADFGLMQPQYTIELTIAKPMPTTMPAGDEFTPPAPETRVLFASRHAGSRYAMLQGGDLIYEAEEKLIADIESEFADTQLLSFANADVVAITFDNEGVFRFKRDDDQWTLDGESTFVVDNLKLEAALSALGALKAQRFVAYENAELDALGLASPRIRIGVDLSNGTHHELVISGIGPNAADRYAQLASRPGSAFVLESTEIAKFDKRAADFKK